MASAETAAAGHIREAEILQIAANCLKLGTIKRLTG